MPYTPVPVVAAGDWIDEVFINTYWVDNMAAGVPDVFTAKGQLAVGTGVDSMGVLSVGTNGYALVADSAEALGVKWEKRAKITLFTTMPSVTGLTTTVGTQSVTASTAISGVPSTAIGIFLFVSTGWSPTVGSLSFRHSSGNVGFTIFGQVAGSAGGNGLVVLNAGTFEKVINTASPTSIAAICLGYIE